MSLVKRIMDYPNLFKCKNNFERYSNIKSVLKYGVPCREEVPCISVIMPVYNSPCYFKEALKSVLNQDVEKPYEVIVVDNNDDSDEPTEYEAIVREADDSRVLYYRNTRNIGMFGNWNRGIELSNAPYFTFCHDDDAFLTFTLSQLMRNADKVKGSALLVPAIRMDEKGVMQAFGKFKIHKRCFGFVTNREFYPYSMLNQILKLPSVGGGCLFSKEKAIALGGFDEDQYPGGDMAFIANYSRHYGLMYMRTPGYVYRVGEQNESNSVWKMFMPFCEHAWNDMRAFIPIPNLILNRLIKARVNVGKYWTPIEWGVNPDNLIPPSKSDVRLVGLFSKICDMNKFKFCWPWEN